MKRRVLLCPGEDGFIVAEVPSLPSCISQGRTRDEALANVREAIALHEEDADVAITVQVRPLSIIPLRAILNYSHLITGPTG